MKRKALHNIPINKHEVVGTDLVRTKFFDPNSIRNPYLYGLSCVTVLRSQLDVERTVKTMSLIIKLSPCEILV